VDKRRVEEARTRRVVKRIQGGKSMKSVISEAINLRTEPVALLLTDERPAGAHQFEPGTWGCVMAMFGAAATKGKTAVFDRETYGCFGGGFGLGFGNTYTSFPGGVEGFCRFLANGNEGWEQGRQIGDGMKAGGARPEFVHHFLHGERYKKDPALVREFLARLSVAEIPTRYAAFVPLIDLKPTQKAPESVTFLVTPDQLAALVVLANYDRTGLENVATPYVAGCQAIGVVAYREARAAKPRCIVGLMDPSARKYLRPQAGPNSFTFTMPYSRFLEMEANVPGSFLEQEPWLSLANDAG
jgi:hypothetical protein